MAQAKKRTKQARVVSQAGKKADKPLLEVARRSDATPSPAERRDTEERSISLTLPTQIGKQQLDRYKMELSQVTLDILEAQGMYNASIEEPKTKLKGLRAEKNKAAQDNDRASGEKIAALMDQIDRVTEGLAELDTQHKAEVAKMEARAKKLASMIRSSVDYSPVKCTLLKNYLTKQQTVTRDDTGEVVEQKAIPLEELQQALPEGD